MIVRSLLGPFGAFTTEQGEVAGMIEVQEVVAELLERALGLDCHECLGRGFVKQPRRLIGWSFDPCPRCAGTGKER